MRASASRIAFNRLDTGLRRSDDRFSASSGTPPILNIFDAGMKFLVNAGLGILPPEAGLAHSELVERTGRTLVTEQLLSRPKGGFPHPYSIPEEQVPLWQEFIAQHPDIPSWLAAEDSLNQAVKTAMNNITLYLRELTALALDGLKKIPGVTIYGPLEADKRGCLVAFNIKGMTATDVGLALSSDGVETRCGHHCVYFAHERYGIKSTGSVRMSFYTYNTPEEIAYALEAVEKISRGEK